MSRWPKEVERERGGGFADKVWVHEGPGDKIEAVEGGREAVGSGRGSPSGATSSKGKRSGKWSRVLETRVEPILGMKQT